MNITVAMSDIAVAKELYERLELKRKAKKISQEKFVENLGISRPAYSRLQKGTCSLNIFIRVLRELDLLEGLDMLVPSTSIRPSEIIHSKKIKWTKNKMSHSSVIEDSQSRSIKHMLAARKKLRV